MTTDPRVRLLAGIDTAEVGDVVRLLDDPTVRVTGDVSAWRHQVILYTLVDLLSRVFRRLDLAVDAGTPAADGLPPGGATVADRLNAIRQHAPLAPLPASEHPTLIVHVGGGSGPADLHVDASEWQSYLGSRPSRLEPPRLDSAVGSVVAACHAGARICSMLLADVLEPSDVDDEVYTSALTYRASCDPIDDAEPLPIGPLDTVLVGAGSVGGGAAYTMAYEPNLAGQLVACDPQTLDDTNPYRSILATVGGALAHESKCDSIARVLAHHTDLTVDVQAMTITDWESRQPAPPTLPLVLVAVDTRESRELVQDALPLDVVNAAVGTDLVAVSGHRTGTGPCMCCLHMPEVLDAASIKNRLIADATGIAQPRVNELRVRRVPLDEVTLRAVERHRDLKPGALAHHAGATLDNLYTADILYGETKVQTDTGVTVAVAAPFVTALAGALLAGEAFKRSTSGLHTYALGVDGPGIQYRENPYLPRHGHLDPHIPRADICLCRSVRRLRHLAAAHSLELTDLTT